MTAAHNNAGTNPDVARARQRHHTIKKPGTPPPERIFQTYLAESAKGQRGAISRTAAVYAAHCSDEYVRRVVRRMERPSGHLRVEHPASLEYTPCPGEMEHRAACRADADRLFLEQLLTPPTSRIMSHWPMPTAPVCQQCTFKQPARVASISIVVGKRATDDTLAWTALTAATTVTAGVLLVATVVPLLALVLLGPVLGLWHVAAETGRIRRRR